MSPTFLSTESDDECLGNNNCLQNYSNTEIFGSHLHVGDSMKDGPPPVFFCMNDAPPLKLPDSRFFKKPVESPGFCSDLYTEA